ncbi:hypothetical protein QOT17_005089 [Balamuthia mandrillaris]
MGRQLCIVLLWSFGVQAGSGVTSYEELGYEGVVGTVLGDVDLDGFSELLFSFSDNSMGLWYTQAANVTRKESVPPPSSPAISLTSLGDLDKNGRPDVVARFSASAFSVGLMNLNDTAFHWLDFTVLLPPPAGPLLTLHPCSLVVGDDTLPIVVALSDISVYVLSFHSNGSLQYGEGIAQDVQQFPNGIDYSFLVRGKCVAPTGYEDALVRGANGDTFALSFARKQDGSIELVQTVDLSATFFAHTTTVVNAFDYNNDGNADYLGCGALMEQCEMLLMAEEAYTILSSERILFSYLELGPQQVFPVGFIPQPQESLYSSVMVVLLRSSVGIERLYLSLGSLPMERNVTAILSPNHSSIQVHPFHLNSSFLQSPTVHLSLANIQLHQTNGDPIALNSSSLSWSASLPITTVVDNNNMWARVTLSTSISWQEATSSLFPSLQVSYDAYWLHHPGAVDGFLLAQDDMKISFAMNWGEPLTQASDTEAVVGCSFVVEFRGNGLNVEEGELIGMNDGSAKRYVFGDVEGEGSVVKVGMALMALVDETAMEEVLQTTWIKKVADNVTRLEVELWLPWFSESLAYDPDFSVLFGEGDVDGEDGEDGFDGDGSAADKDDDDDEVLAIVLPSVLVPLVVIGAVGGVVAFVLVQKWKAKRALTRSKELRAVNYQ